MVSESLINLRWRACTSLWRSSEAFSGTPRMGWSHEGCQQKCWVPRGGDCDVSHCLGMRYAYMYKLTVFDITRFKAMMTINLSELRSQACFCESSTGMCDLRGSLVRESQKRTIFCHGKWVVTKDLGEAHETRTKLWIPQSNPVAKWKP